MTAPAHAATDAQKKSAAEKKRAALGKQLKAIKREIKKKESAKESVADHLAANKKAISKTNRDLLALQSKQSDTQNRLKKLSGEELRLLKTIGQQQKQLSKLLRGMYIRGESPRLKLLLSGDNPNRVSREMQYMGYVAHAETALIARLRDSLSAIKKNRSETQTAKKKLATIASAKQAKKKKLEKEKQKRAALLTKLSKQIAAKKKEAKRIVRNQKRMSNLVNQLSRLIAKRKKEAARKRKEWKSKEKKGLVNNKEPRASDDPKDGVFARRKGKLHLPVRGTITERFGSKKGGGPAKKGVFIQTKKGAKIKAVASGKIVFADWLRGFGNLIIIDHGSQYMTIYANNHLLYKKVGRSVKAGDVIATAGSSGSRQETGLYFEMRRRGRAFDPLKWVKIR